MKPIEVFDAILLFLICIFIAVCVFDPQFVVGLLLDVLDRIDELKAKA